MSNIWWIEDSFVLSCLVIAGTPERSFLFASNSIMGNLLKNNIFWGHNSRHVNFRWQITNFAWATMISTIIMKRMKEDRMNLSFKRIDHCIKQDTDAYTLWNHHIHKRSKLRSIICSQIKSCYHNLYNEIRIRWI